MRRALAGITVTLAFIAASVPTAAQEDDDDPSDADHLVVVEQTPWVVPGGTFAMRVRVDDPPDGAQMRMALHRPVGTRSAFVRSLDGEGLRGTLVEGVVPLEERAVADDGSVIVRIITGPVTGERVDVELGDEDEGVYPVVLELLDADDAVVDRLITHLVRLPDPDPEEFPLGTVVVVPLHAEPSHVGPGEVDATALAQLDVTIDALADHPGVTLTLLPTPEAIAGAVQTDPSAARRVDEVVGDRTVVSRPWVRLDPVAWRRAGLRDELLRQIDAGGRTMIDATGVTPDSGIAVIPAGGGPAAVDDAVDGGADVVLVPEADLEPLDEDDFPVTLTRPFEVEVGNGSVPALMVDAGLQARVGATGDAVLDAHRLLADLAVLALDAPLAERAAVIVLDDEAAAEPAFLEAFLAGLDQRERVGAAPLVRTANVGDLIDAVEPAGADGGADADDPLVRIVLPGEAAPALDGLRDDLAEGRADVATYRAVFGSDDQLAADVEELILTAGASSLNGAERGELLATGTALMQAQLDGLHGPVPAQRVTLTAREGRVQLVFGNDTGQAADVLVELQGDRLEFPGHADGRLPVHLEPGTTRVELVLRARSSGDARLDLRITTPDGRVELGRSSVTVRATAVSGVGLVLMTAAALFLVVWWTRTFLRERGTPRPRRPVLGS